MRDSTLKPEAGKSSITLDKLQQLSDRLGLSPLTLLTLTISESTGESTTELVNKFCGEIRGLASKGEPQTPPPLTPKPPTPVSVRSAYPRSDTPTMRNHTALATLADELGFAALWLRDVPFRDPAFGDVGQIYDPMVYAGWLAAATRYIAIGTAGIVLPLRDPLAVAKQALSVDQLTG